MATEEGQYTGLIDRGRVIASKQAVLAHRQGEVASKTEARKPRRGSSEEGGGRLMWDRVTKPGRAVETVEF